MQKKTMAFPSDCRRLFSSVLGLGTVLLVLGGAPGFAAEPLISAGTGQASDTVTCPITDNNGDATITCPITDDGDGTINCADAPELGKNCGRVSICGQTLRCGPCTAPETCGGSGIPNVCGLRTVDVSGCWTGSFQGWQNGTVPTMKLIQEGDQFFISGGLDTDGDNTIDVPFRNLTEPRTEIQTPMIEVGTNLYGKFKLFGPVGRAVWLQGKTNLIVTRIMEGEAVAKKFEATHMSWRMVTSTLEKISARLTVYPDRNVTVSVD